MGLLLLLFVAALFAGGALFVKYKLEGLREAVQEEILARTGARLQVGSVLVNGLRGLRLDDLEITLTSEAGPVLDFKSPLTYIYIDLIDLLYGEVSVERVQADNAVIRFTRPLDQPWMTGKTVRFQEAPRLLERPSFHFTGTGCRLEVVNVVGETRLDIDDFAFDIIRMPGFPDITAKFAGALASAPDKKAKVNMRFASFEDFDLRLECDAITAGDVAVFLPASQRVVQSGEVSPTVRVAGYPNNTLIVAFEAPFKDFSVRNQPAFIRPATGSFSGVAAYDTNTHELTITAGKAESASIGGRIEGAMSFAGGKPKFDLRLEATGLPLNEALQYAFESRASEYGTFDFQVHEPHALHLALQGSAEEPVISISGDAAGGVFTFAPNDPRFPTGELNLGRMTLSWQSGQTEPVGSFTVVDGSLTHAFSGISAQKIAGALTFEEGRVSIDPLNAVIKDHPFVASIQYNIAEQTLRASLNGLVSGIEDSRLAKLSPHLSLAGSANLNCELVKTPGKVTIDGELEATQTEIGLFWWFLKPPGVGMAATNIHAEIVPQQSFSFAAGVGVASSQLALSGEGTYRGGKWVADAFRITSEQVDAIGAAQCLRLPYALTGGVATNGTYEWVRDGGQGEDIQWHMSAGFNIDEIALTPNGAETPQRYRGVRLAVSQTEGAESTGRMSVQVEQASMPALGEPWFIPMKTDPEILEMYPDRNREWTYELAAETLEVPPWKGSAFKGTAQMNLKEGGLREFSADIEGGGHVEGSYWSIREDNAYEMSFDWKDTPVNYLIDQMGYPHVFTGTSSGKLTYSMDRDDPGTLKGGGVFEIRQGQFSADFLISQLEGRLEDQLTALPLSLGFERLSANVGFDGDTVTTKDLILVAQGLTLTGEGTYVRDGDMDYDLKVAFSPEVAKQIPVLRDNLSVQGHKLAQQDIELAFKLKGPLFDPKGQLSAPPPVGVTLVSGALEITSDAIKVIDAPRKILFDLLRIGGGIVGAAR